MKKERLMNPELRDPERAFPAGPKAAVRQKAEQIERDIKSATEGLKELQKLMGQVPVSDLAPDVALKVGDLRVSAVEAAEHLGGYLLLPIVVKFLYEDHLR